MIKYILTIQGLNFYTGTSYSEARKTLKNEKWAEHAEIIKFVDNVPVKYLDYHCVRYGRPEQLAIVTLQGRKEIPVAPWIYDDEGNLVSRPKIRGLKIRG